VHVVVEEDRYDSRIFTTIREALHDQFGIDHTIIQLEKQGFKEPKSIV
jgi:Co/Zn/Cd efflux system component